MKNSAGDRKFGSKIWIKELFNNLSTFFLEVQFQNIILLSCKKRVGSAINSKLLKILMRIAAYVAMEIFYQKLTLYKNSDGSIKFPYTLKETNKQRQETFQKRFHCKKYPLVETRLQNTIIKLNLSNIRNIILWFKARLFQLQISSSKILAVKVFKIHVFHL